MRTPQGQVSEPSLTCLDSPMENARKPMFWSFGGKDPMKTPSGPGFRAKPQMPRCAHGTCSKTPVLELWRGRPHEAPQGQVSEPSIFLASGHTNVSATRTHQRKLVECIPCCLATLPSLRLTLSRSAESPIFSVESDHYLQDGRVNVPTCLPGIAVYIAYCSSLYLLK